MPSGPASSSKVGAGAPTAVASYTYATPTLATSGGVEVKAGGSGWVSMVKLWSTEPAALVARNVTACGPTWSRVGVHSAAPVDGSTVIPVGAVTSAKVGAGLPVARA
ncbi:MAG: hypothetical protein IPK07_15540 [Deltaproteobacteria bacterium]|nr:hypothetical protein [Deltaproteobacteria bacterium]